MSSREEWTDERINSVEYNVKSVFDTLCQRYEEHEEHYRLAVVERRPEALALIVAFRAQRDRLEEIQDAAYGYSPGSNPLADAVMKILFPSPEPVAAKEVQPKERKCEHCGTFLNLDSDYCPECGGVAWHDTAAKEVLGG